MRKMNYIIVLLHLCYCSCQEILTQEGDLDFGHFFDWDSCPVNSFAKGFDVKIDKTGVTLRDDQGMTGARLYCVDENGEEIKTVYSHDLRKGDWREPNMCGEGEWLKGFRIRLENYQGWTRDDTGVNNLEMICTSGETLVASGTSEGSWLEWAECPEGEAICGLRTKAEEKLLTDHLGLVAIQMRCCPLSFDETERPELSDSNEPMDEGNRTSENEPSEGGEFDFGNGENEGDNDLNPFDNPEGETNADNPEGETDSENNPETTTNSAEGEFEEEFLQGSGNNQVINFPSNSNSNTTTNSSSPENDDNEIPDRV